MERRRSPGGPPNPDWPQDPSLASKIMPIRALEDSGREVRVEPTQALQESPLPRPHIDYMVDRRLWILLAEYRYPDGEHTLILPYGFTCNLASVPRFIWPLMSSFELGIVGPLVHDFLYQRGGKPKPGECVPPRSYTRAEADRLFKEIMKREKVPGWRWRAAYQAVRWFGSGWR